MHAGDMGDDGRTEGLVDLDLLATAADDGEGGAPAGEGRQARRRHNRRGDHGGCHLARALSQIMSALANSV